MTIKCDICLGKFANSILLNNICRFCTIRTELENKLTLERHHRAELEDKVNALEAKLNSLLDNKYEKKPSNFNSHNDDFKTVNSKRQKSNVIKQNETHISLENRFELLNDNEEIGNIVIGDSQIRNIGKIMNNKKENSKKKNTAICYPGATTEFIGRKIEELTIDSSSTDIAIHVGGNDIREIENNTFKPTEKIIQNYKKMLEKVKDKSRRSFVIGILPRHNESIE